MKPRILTICQGGNCRSVCAAYVFKWKYNCDAISVGWEANSPETIAMLCDWADRIFVMESHFAEKIPLSEANHGKLFALDVGEDVWFGTGLGPLHPDLFKLIEEKVAAWVKEDQERAAA